MTTATPTKRASARPSAPANAPTYSAQDDSSSPSRERVATWHLTDDQYHSIWSKLRHASSLVDLFIVSFGGDIELKEKPASLEGSLQLVCRILDRVTMEILDLRTSLPDSVFDDSYHAQSVMNLVRTLQLADDFGWNQEDSLICDIFDAARSSIERALEAMNDQVKIRKESA